MKANDLQKFSFRFEGPGHYTVIYRTERGDYYKSLVTDMTLIDATKNAEWAKTKDIEMLRDHVKRNGKHYNLHGNVIE